MHPWVGAGLDDQRHILTLLVANQVKFLVHGDMFLELGHAARWDIQA